MKKGFSRDSGPGEDVEPRTKVAGESRGLSQVFKAATFRSLKNSAFRLYWGALLCQMAAMNMQMMARSLLIYRITGSATILGMMSLFHAIPMLCLSLFGGVIADRLPKKYVMIAGQAVSMVVSLAVAVSLATGYLNADHGGSWWVLAVASVVQGTVMGLMMPSRQSVLPEIVGGEQLLNAVSLGNVGTSGMRLLAPALTGFLIEAYGFGAVYFTMTALYALSVMFIVFLPVTGTTSLRGAGALADIKEGIRYLRGQTTILFILGFTLAAVLLSMPYMLLMPIFVDDILKVGASGMGILLSVSGAGAIASSFVLASLPNKKRGLLLLVSCLVMAVALVGFAQSTSWPLSLGVIVFVGIGQTGRMTLGNTLIQYYVDDEYRGRVMSVYMMEFGLTSFGTFAAGVMAETMGVQSVVGGFAATLVVISLLSLIFVRRIRNLD